MASAFKTASFRLQNPSRHKRAALDHVMRAYEAGARQLLGWASAQREMLADRCASVDATGQTRYRLFRMEAVLREFHWPERAEVGADVYDSLLVAVGTMLAAYFTKRAAGEAGEFPGSGSYAAGEYERILERLGNDDIPVRNSADQRHWRNRLGDAAAEHALPLYFRRSRMFNLRRQADGRWGIELVVLPRDSRFGGGRLRFALAFGQWHEREFLRPGKPRVAYLIKQGDDFFLRVVFEYAAASIQTTNLLGLSHFSIKRAALAICDENGQLLFSSNTAQESDAVQTAQGRRVRQVLRWFQTLSREQQTQAAIQQWLQVLANYVVSVAVRHQAQVVLEDLNVATEQRRGVWQFNQLERILSYKLPLAGLPAPRKVFSARVAIICAVCGADGEINAHERDRFWCVHCGAETDSDANAAINIARRVLYRKAEWLERGGYQAFHRSFAV